MSNTFGARAIFSTPAREGFVQENARADFNGDGIDDLMIARLVLPLENRGLPLQLLIGDGRGGFSDQTSTVFAGAIPTAVHPREFVLGDFNADGRPDLFVADHGYDVSPFPGAQNRLILSTGTGQLRDASANLPQINDFTHSAAAGDIDGDGDLDILSVNTFGETRFNPLFLINDGTGRFTQNTTFLPAVTQAVGTGGAQFTTAALIDVNLDGRPDLILGSAEVARAPTQVLINPGNGNFSGATAVAIPTPALRASTNFSGGPGSPTAYDVQPINLNGDALPDLAVVWTNGNVTAAYIQLLRNDGSGRFVDETAQRLPQDLNNADPWVKYLHLIDTNGDGYTDILTELVTGSPTLYTNNGTGVFSRTATLPLTNSTIEPIDVNRDGRWDLVSATGSPNATFGVLTNTAGGASAIETATDLADTLIGGPGGDLRMGLAGADRIDTRGGNDFLNGAAGADTLIGGLGTDTAVFASNRAQNTISVTGSGSFRVQGPEGTDIAIGVEQFRFLDGTVSLTSLLAPQQANGSNPVFRFFNSQTGVHFFTASEGEALSVMAGLDTFLFEGAGYRSAISTDPGQVDIHRFLNRQTSTHFYTASAAERDAITRTLPHFAYEGVAYRAYAADAGPQEEVYRFFNTQTGTHFYTSSEAERDAVLVGLPQFRFEGIAFWGVV